MTTVVSNTPREICCCGAYSWAKVIGTIQIVLYTFGMIMLTLLVIRLGSTGLPDTTSLDEAGVTQEEKKELGNKITTVLIVVTVIGAIISIIGIVTGILLIKGANQGNTKYLTIWIVFAAICFGWKIIEAFVGSGNFVASMIVLLIATAMYGFGIWVVFVLKREIEAGVVVQVATFVKPSAITQKV